MSFSLTLSNLLTQTRVFLRDTATTASRQRFSDSQLTDFLNDGQKEFNAKIWAVISATPIVLTAGTTEYSLPTDNISVLRVTFKHTPLVERTFSFFDESNTDWISSSGTPHSYYVRVDSSIVAGVARESIGFIPISTFSTTCHVYFLDQPTDLSASGDVPFGSDNRRLYPFHHGLAFYGAYRGFLTMGLLQEAIIYLKEYENIISLAESFNKTRNMFNPNLRGSMPIVTPQPQQ